MSTHPITKPEPGMEGAKHANWKVMADKAFTAVQTYSTCNPIWTDRNGVQQDPCGAHAWLKEYRGLNDG